MVQAPPSALARAVPVNEERGARHRVMGATDWWFYPLIALCAVGLILVSLGGDAFEQVAVPQHAASRTGSELVYSPHELARGARLDSHHVRYVVRDFGVSARAVRFAVKPKTAAPTGEDKGVQLLLNPAETAPLAGVPVRVVLGVHRFSITAAGGVAVSLQNGGAITWVTAALPPESNEITIDLPPLPGAAPTALGIWMLTDRTDFNYGTELNRVTLKSGF